MKTSRKSQLFRRLLAASLLVGGTFNLAAPVLAAGTTAGTPITNTASGTYEDSNAPGVPINTTSNTVTITVAEVAGISLTQAAAPADVNGGSIQPGDVVNYDFLITNTGNDATRFFIPDTATVTGATQRTIQYSTDGGQNFTNVTAGGSTTTSIPVNGTVLVRVPVTITAASGSSASVRLGNTGTNNNEPATTQNQSDAADGAVAGEVRTVDNSGTAGGDASAAAPANGERESSLFQTVTVGVAPDIQNGPNAQPNAVGPTSNNDDFTNTSTAVPANLDPAQPFNPGLKNITNTLANGSTVDPAIVSLLPTPPANTAALPAGTLVTITLNAGETATYSYDPATGFTYVSGTGTSATDPVEVPLGTSAPNNTANYTVSIDLPANTPQFSTFPVPITAFEDIDGNGLIAATGESANTTIDNLYTGFLSLLKESRVIQAAGPAVPAGQDTFSTAPKSPAPGNIVEYRITYTNLSSPAPSNGSGNIVMNANVVSITEDGTIAPNNWATDATGDGALDTSNVPDTAAASSGTISYFSGNPGTTPATRSTTGTTATTDVTRYVLNLGNSPVAPQGTGNFTIQRRVN